MNELAKFRGLRVDGKGWVYGHYYLYNNKYYIGSEDHSDDASIYKNDEVIPETVGQWIGEKDVNGTEIYDGDIIHENGATIVWNDDLLSWAFKHDNDGDNISTPLFYDKEGLKRCKVLGNKHEK